jgi:D-alanyl-D-alanine carboxypeptidase
MNNLAKSIGMKDTIFVNSSGLEDSNGENYSTVYDMALLSSYAIKNEEYRKIVGTKNITVKTDLKTYVWHNKNRLLHSYEYCIGGKTGFTEKARRTLVTNASKDNVNLTVVTFNDGNDFSDHKVLYEKYFNKLKSYQILYKGKIDTKYPNTYIDNDFWMSLTNEEANNIKLEINYYDNNASNIIGYVDVIIDGVSYHKENIFKKEKKDTEKISFWDKLKKRIFG